MRTIRLRWLACFIVGSLSAQSAVSLKDFYSRLVEPGVAAPAYDSALAVIDQIPKAQPAVIEDALPVVAQSLRNSNEQAVIYGIWAVSIIGMRPDRNELLAPYLDRLGTLLIANPDTRVHAGLLTTFQNLNPANFAKVRPQVLKSLQMNAVFQNRMSDAGVLIRNTPNSADVLEALAACAKEPRNTPSRSEFIRQLAIPGLSHPQLLKLVQDGLSDPNPDMKISSLHSMRRIGPNAVNPAKHRLFEISLDPNEDPRVKQRADEVLHNLPEGSF